VYSCTNTLNICIIFQLKGDQLDNNKVLEEINNTVQFARSQGKEVDVNKLKSSMTACGNEGKYYRTVQLLSCFNF
jgi:hypothetical protein